MTCLVMTLLAYFPVAIAGSERHQSVKTTLPMLAVLPPCWDQVRLLGPPHSARTRTLEGIWLPTSKAR